MNAITTHVAKMSSLTLKTIMKHDKRAEEVLYTCGHVHVFSLENMSWVYILLIDL